MKTKTTLFLLFVAFIALSTPTKPNRRPIPSYRYRFEAGESIPGTKLVKRGSDSDLISRESESLHGMEWERIEGDSISGMRWEKR